MVTASLGLPAELRGDAPWLLGGAKTLSYAVNMASQRWAQPAGADDVLWVSTDGYALEAPTSTLVWLRGEHAVDRAGRADRHPGRHHGPLAARPRWRAGLVAAPRRWCARRSWPPPTGPG